MVRQAKKDGRSVQFASLIDVCHPKHSELAEHLQRYRGRVVLWGGDDNGYRATSTEQSASASHMTVANFLKTISRLLDMGVEVHDAIPAYTHVRINLMEIQLSLLILSKSQSRSTL